MINVVLGPPVAGKSEYVKTHAKDGNVIVDYDLIAKAMGSRVAHDSTGSVRYVALESRQAAIERILRGLDDPSWIIHTNPQPQMLQAYADAGAKFTMLDPGKNEVLRRAKAGGRPASTIQAIEEWYANPPIIPEKSNGQKVMNLDLQAAFDAGFEAVKKYLDAELAALSQRVIEVESRPVPGEIDLRAVMLPPEIAAEVALAVRTLHEIPPYPEYHEAASLPNRIARIERDEEGNLVPIYADQAV